MVRASTARAQRGRKQDTEWGNNTSRRQMRQEKRAYGVRVPQEVGRLSIEKEAHIFEFFLGVFVGKLS